MADSFAQPAAYWLRRAEKKRQEGQFSRAVVLERHAARVEPDNDQAQQRYVMALQEFHCYQSSLREAFGALARRPQRQALYGLIAQSLAALDQGEEAADASALCPAQNPFWEDEPLWEPWRQELPKRQARLEGLLHMACLRLISGDASGAAVFLQKAERFPAPNARREELKALLLEACHQPERAQAAMGHALDLEPRNARLLCSAACMLSRMGRPNAARGLLMKAAACASRPEERQAVCLAGDFLGDDAIPISMLDRAVCRGDGDQYVLYHDLCVCRLRRGELGKAVPCIHLCREMDPDDVPGQFLFQLVEQLNHDQLTDPEQVKVRSRLVSYYGVPCPELLNFFIQPLLEAAACGPQELANLLCAEPAMRRLYLFALSAGHDRAEDLLPSLCSALPPREAETLLRELLLQTPDRLPIKDKALSLLSAMGAPAPYLQREEGRLSLMDPACPNRRATFRQRYLTRRISRGALLADDDGFPLWAMEQIHHMSRAQRTCVVADPARIWPLALALRYNELRRRQPVRIPLEGLNPTRLKHLAQALQILNFPDTKEAPTHEDH